MFDNSLVTPTVRAKTADKSLVESEACIGQPKRPSSNV
jgi:hypothetical protein